MASKPPVHVTVTGAAGQIGYSLLFRIASGQLLGPDQPIVLRLLEIEPAMKVLEGVVMEIDDCAFPLVHDIVATSDLKTAFDGTSWALLVGSVPRKAGMERGDLLNVNGGIFKPQGRAIAENAASDVRVLVVGNPCNTNCLIARSNAPEVPADRWFAMTRLDENRAKAQLAAKAGCPGGRRHQPGHLGQPLGHAVPRLRQRAHRRQGGHRRDHRQRVARGDFITTVQKRGAAIIDARGSSSAASAASAAIDTVVSLRTATPAGDCFSVAVASTGQYGAPEGLQFGFPVVADGKGGWSVVEGFSHDEFAEERIKVDDRRAPGRAQRRQGARPDREYRSLPGVPPPGVRHRAVRSHETTPKHSPGTLKAVGDLFDGYGAAANGLTAAAFDEMVDRDGRPGRPTWLWPPRWPRWAPRT